jgi:hypothetical protein
MIAMQGGQAVNFIQGNNPSMGNMSMASPYPGSNNENANINIERIVVLHVGANAQGHSLQTYQSSQTAQAPVIHMGNAQTLTPNMIPNQIQSQVNMIFVSRLIDNS